MKSRRIVMRFLCLWVGMISVYLVNAQDIVLTGVNKGEDLYVKNPYIIARGAFCVQEIYVNGKKSDVNVNLTAIRLPLDEAQLYAPVHIKVVHADSCQPRIVNPDAILYYTSFKFDSLVMKDSVLHWYTKGDRRDAIFVIEKLKNTYWEEVAKIRPKGRFNGAEYVYFPELTEGGNKFRIRYEQANGRYLYSPEVEHFHYPDGVSFSPRVVTDRMYFSREARYEIMDSTGEVILQGTAKEIPLKRLKPGDYSILLEGQLETFVKL